MSNEFDPLPGGIENLNDNWSILAMPMVAAAVYAVYVGKRMFGGGRERAASNTELAMAEASRASADAFYRAYRIGRQTVKSAKSSD